MKVLMFIPIHQFLDSTPVRHWQYKLQFDYGLIGADIVVNQLKDEHDVDYIDFNARAYKRYNTIDNMACDVVDLLDEQITYINSRNYDYILCSFPQLENHQYSIISLTTMYVMNSINAELKLIGGQGLLTRDDYDNYVQYEKVKSPFMGRDEKIVKDLTWDSFKSIKSYDDTIERKIWDLINIVPDENQILNDVVRYPKTSVILKRTLTNKSDIRFKYKEIFDNFDYQIPKQLENKEIQTTSMNFSIVCPYNCYYCRAEQLEYGEIKHKFTLKKMQDVLMSYIDQGFNTFLIMDRIANLWPEEFFNWIVQKNLDIKWSCSFRLNKNPDYWKMIKEAGCVNINVGIENPSPRMLKLINKKLTVDEIERNLEWAHDAGLLIMGNFILNLLGETKDDVDYMFDFIIKHNYKFLRFSIGTLRLVRNSEWHDNPEKYGIKLLNKYHPELRERYTLQRFNNSEDDMFEYYKQNVRDFKKRLKISGLRDSWAHFPYNILFALVDIFDDVSDIKKWFNNMYYKNILPQ